MECLNQALNRNDSGDKWLPFRSGHRALGVEHGNGAGFVTIAPCPVDGLNAGKRFGRVTNGFDLLMQGWLIVLELNDQMGIRGGGGFEGFFWQCIASQVTIRPATSSSSSSF